MDRLTTALDNLDRISENSSLSDNERVESVKRQYEYIILLMAQELIALKRLVKSICDDRP